VCSTVYNYLNTTFNTTLNTNLLSHYRYRIAMGVMQRVVKPRNKRSQRALEAREPKAIESSKKVLIVRGNKCSEKVNKSICILLPSICIISDTHGILAHMDSKVFTKVD